MFEWLSQQYIKLILNYQILLGNPSGCGTVELLRLFSFTLIAVFALKLGAHLLIFNYLKRKFSRYSVRSHPELFRLYERSAQIMILKKLPALFAFENVRPLVFTIGSLRPAIFLAPALVNKLKSDELEAIFVHELTHIKRRDNLLVWFLEIFFLAIPILFIQVFAISFVFSVQNSVYAILGTLVGLTVFKAFVWKRILFLRELSCDDLSVDKIKDPLILAASITNVWRLAKSLPRYRWQTGLAFTQTLLPATMRLETRVQRLLNYKRPWFKFFLGKALRVAAVLFILSTSIFLWQFYSKYGHLDFGFGENTLLHICSSICEH
ncbi:MAG: M56 family metallopeptidase [bacterium]